MADVQECIGKLVATGTISRAIGDEALAMFRRSKAEYTKSMGPASADAAAALEAAKTLRTSAADKQLKAAAYVKTWRDNERRIIEDPRGGMLGVNAVLSKDTLLGDNRLAALRRTDPQHPIFTRGSVDSNRNIIRRWFYNMLGPDIDKFKGPAGAVNASDLIDEIKGVDTGNKFAKAVAENWHNMVKEGETRGRLAGIDVPENEHWDTPQGWQSRRVGKFTEAEFVKDFLDEVNKGGLKLIDKPQPTAGGLAQSVWTQYPQPGGGFYARADRHVDILKKAYADIKFEGGTAAPFSDHMRTFEFQNNKAGADAWKRLQGKYGAGNEFMQVLDGHIDRMSSTIALHEMLGPNPQAAFEALVRLAKEQNQKEALAPGLRWLGSETTARKTFNEVSGHGDGPVGNEVWARRMSGIRSALGAAALRNLPISIIPSDAAMTFLAAHHDGMSGLDIISHTLAGGLTRQEAAHLQIAAHSYQDFIQNSYRRYEDEINVSGLARKLPSMVVKATGAQKWTENIRLGYQLSYFHQLADMADRPWTALDPRVRDNFLAQYGITSDEWDKIRNIPADVAPNGAKYVNIPELTKADRELSERLQRAVGERSSYGAHQPDARTRAIAHGGAQPGTLGGEQRLAMAMYKQFALERMSTHLMRVLYEGSKGDRVMRGIAFVLLSTGAGALSLQTAEILAGKNPHDMSDPGFWMRSFAKGGAGGVFGDLLADALTGDTRTQAGLGFIGGPVGGVLGDVAKVVTSPVRHDLFDQAGRRVTSGPASDTFTTLRRWTPNTWYTKLAVDRLFYDQLQTLLDPNYRESFRRMEQYAQRRGGGGYWFAPGETSPGFMQ